MKILYIALLVGLILVSSPTKLIAQAETALPFLLIKSSPEGNGMGGISASIITDNAMAMVANPGQLGLNSLNNYLSSGLYTPKSLWLPPFQNNDLTYNVGAINAGVNLKKFFSLPFPVSVGLGYSRIFLNLGTFAVTLDDPTPIATFEGHEKAENYSIAIGAEYYIKLGLGINFKSIESVLAPISGLPGATGPNSNRKGIANPTTNDIGLIAQLPVIDVLSKIKNELFTFSPTLKPLFDVTFGYTRSNLGDETVIYIDPAQGDPLPRTATLGLSWKFGLVTHAASHDWEVVSFTLAREAEDVLVKRFPAQIDTMGNIISNPTFQYQDGAGDIQFFKNVIMGEGNDDVTLHKGWQLNVGEILYIRGGSVNGTGLVYLTDGFGLRLSGVFRLIETLDRTATSSPFFQFITSHIDLRFDHASEKSDSPRNGTSYSGLNLIIK